MEIPAIHVHTQCDKSTVPFAQFMWETMLSLANHPEYVQLTVHCMGPTAAVRASGWPGKFQSIITPTPKGDPLNGSRGHGVCAMEALSMTGDGDIHVICDSDTVMVSKGWDDYLRLQLLDNGVMIVGSTYEDIGGASSGSSKVQTYKKIPTLTWCALSPLHDWRKLDVIPNKGHMIAITTQELSDTYNLPIGYTTFGEVGWQIPRYVRDNDLMFEGWRQLKPSKDALVLKGLDDYHEEFHAGGAPFVVHHRGSMRHAYRGDRISNLFYGAVDKYLIDEKERKTRFGWLTDENKPPIPVFVKISDEQKTETPDVVEQPKQKTFEVMPKDYVAKKKEWLKMSFNGSVISARGGVNRTAKPVELKFEKPPMDRVGHLRIEGVLEHSFPIALPGTKLEPYMITVRNATFASLFVASDVGTHVAVPPQKTWFIMVDVDGAQRVE